MIVLLNGALGLIKEWRDTMSNQKVSFKTKKGLQETILQKIVLEWRLPMTSEKMMKAGAIAGIIIAIVAVLLSDMHSVPDLVITLAQGRGNVIVLPEGFTFPYWLAGAVGEPILIISIFVFGLGFIGAWRKIGEKTAKTAGIIAFIYGAERIFEAIATVKYAIDVESVRATGDLTSLIFPGMLKGMSALITGITGGIILASLIAIYFSRTGIKLGKIGGLLVIITVATGILVKTLSLWIWPYGMTAAFLLLMCTKSMGIAFMSIALYQQAR